MLESKSDLIVESCLKHPIPDGLDQFKFKIEEWLYKQKQNKALFICEEDGNDIQCLISYWMKGLNKDIIIPYFVEHENQNYQYAIFYVLSKLKTIFNISQKVEIEGEKLKQFFQYWLEFYSRELQNQVFSDTKCVYKRLILIFQGIDKFRDQNGEVRASYWLPRILPENVKLIVTGRTDSKAYEQYCSQGGTIIQMQKHNLHNKIEIKPKKNFLTDYQFRIKVYRKIPQNLADQAYFCKCFELILTNKNEDYQDVIKESISQIENIKTDVDFFTILIKSFLKYFPENHYISILTVLTFVFKGISLDEIVYICGCEKEHVFNIHEFFKIFLMEKSQIYYIQSISFKNALIQYLPSNKQLYHQFITIMEHSQNNIRKLEELIYQYTRTKRYFKLKEVLINVENFLMMCSPNHKFELCHLWETLEQNGYDLVMEYNKAIENFQALYKPTNEGLFYIMLQICRFLREFSNFENDHTPPYKHPELRGQSIEFDEIGLYNELKQLQMIAKKKTKQMNEEYFPQQQGNIESLNMDIKANRDFFINYYINQFDQNLVQEYINTKQEHILDKIITNTRNQQNYYYKRWIWVQFPWLALTQKNNYSKLMDYYNTNNIPMSEELQINQKAIKLALIAKQTKQMKDHNSSKLPSINSSIRMRQFSPLDSTRNLNILKTRADSEHNKTERSFKKISLPSLQKIQFQKKLDQIMYQNQLLKNRLKDYTTIRQNMYPDEVNGETQKTLENNKCLQEDLKKQQENLSIVQLEMKRMNIVWKLCLQNQDYNEDRAQQLVKHSKNLDKLIAEQITIIKESSEKVQSIKQKSKIETKKVQQEKKQIQQQLEASRRLTYFQNIPPSPGMISNIENSYFLDTNKKHQNQQQNIAIHSNNEVNNSGNEIKIKFVRLKSEKMEENILKGVNFDSHTQDLVNQLTDLGIENPYQNQKWMEFCDKIQKNYELQLEIQNRQQRLHELKNMKAELQINKKILSRQIVSKNSFQVYQHYSSFQRDDVIRSNDFKMIQLKELKQHQAVIKFYNNNLYNLLNTTQKLTSNNIHHMGNILCKMT
ncbi:unnamed protein product [Paramecium sonneborni]|uniref:Uncharacterized protein n=1 Tax=Paramecium sonneborni TaxID=65129 RepID=A0A8S1QPE5_9CILI|nr:unnamed protein product [Paramecium sonneborni]